MTTTPAHLGAKVDWAVDHLNARWDLRLPKLHGAQARNAGGNDRLAFQCFSRIRMLTFRSVPIEKIIEEFDVEARQIHSQWVYKPSQEKGTLATLPVTKSFIEREKCALQLKKLSASERNQLSQALFKVLDEYCKLAQLSHLTRTQSTPITPRRAGAHEGLEPRLKSPGTASVKRSILSPDSKSKRQQTLKQLNYFRPPPFYTKSEPLSPSHTRSHPEITSFDTIATSRTSSVFDHVEGYSDISHQTSVLEGFETSPKAEQSQDLLPTQELDELMEDDDFRRSFHESSFLSNDSDAALSNTFPEKRQLPSSLPFWLSWESDRLAGKTGDIPIDFYETIRKRCKTDVPTFDAYWEAAREYFRQKQISLPPKSDIPLRMASENKYSDLHSTKAVYLTANLVWNKDLADGWFKLETQEMRLEQSCRFYRKFGADRFLVLFTPEFSPTNYPEALKSRANDRDLLRKRITNFLTGNSHFIAGRYWRVFYVEPDKKKRRKDQSSRLKFFLFAETGYDIIAPPSPVDLYADSLDIDGHHQEIELKLLADWHMQFEANAQSTDLKLFSRCGLGLSKTTPTETLNRNEFIVRHDSPSSPVMNDGCALISFELAQAIWKKLGGQGDMPCAFQGRISGAKGLWIVDFQNRHSEKSERGYWIEVSDSQLKIKPHPRHRKCDDVCLRTFEVLNWAGECKPGHLNLQLITVLEDGGVPRAAFEDALMADTQSFSESLKAAIKDERDGRPLLVWMQTNGLLGPIEKKNVLGSFPSDRRQQLRLLLESSFSPSESTKVKDCVKTILMHYMTNYVERLWITQISSTTVFCVPDPTGKLKHDEVCLNFSKAVKDPRSGMSELVLNDIEVLVARNPAYLASDVQKRKAVYIHELRHYRNVIIFPTTGTRPLASMLSGGDYDGDTCWVCWDPAIVEPFKNSELPTMPSPESCGMRQESRPLGEIFTKDRPFQEALNDFFQACVEFNARPSLMGSCSTEHEKLIYSISQQGSARKLSHPGAVMLATLAGYLVDSNKQGWSLNESAWFSFRAEANGGRKLHRPAFKTSSPPQRQQGTFANIMDFLKFEVAEREKDNTLAGFQKLNSEAGVYDGVLSATWKDLWKKALDEKKASEKRSRQSSRGSKSSSQPRSLIAEADHEHGHGTYLICDDLIQRIEEIQKRWREVASPEELSDSAKYTYAIRQIYEPFLAIEPKKIDHPIRRRFEEETTLQFSYWSLLRASCLHYHICRRGIFPEWVWSIAGRELCHLKAISYEGPVRLVPENILDMMKVSSKLAKALEDRQTMDADADAEEMDAEDMIDVDMMEE
ncbi:uncharacterized protein PV06_01607 [Exophiala oligosperma]|uniref:RNA-dependent RNA polymerase n=1 Tax=Exophiala oligosperma TaxID=215243 RepID=A0A0D2B189_9EURO|nr:uncharacterized protein PV06_01607 [Exophiala oligosperma]KIW45901.1 hypothetical protein PV06_01607 [Exophiala oligosperma]